MIRAETVAENCLMPRSLAVSRVIRLLRRWKGTTHLRARATRLCSSPLERLEDRRLLAMAGVDVINFAFAPNPVTIHQGDTVEWVWDTDNHSTTSVAGSLEQWNSGVHDKGFVFEHTFTHVGTFSYYCSLHGYDNRDGTAGGMSGEIIVLPPSPLMMVMVTPANFNLTTGSTMQYMAMGMYADNTLLDVTADATWASTNTAVASVSSSASSPGLVTALAPGTSTISATVDGMSGATPVNVAEPAPVVHMSNVHDTLNKRHMVTQITIGWSAPLNASQAGDVAFFRLATAGKKGSFDAKNARMIKLKSATYVPALNEVVLTPAKPFTLSKPVQLMVSGQPTAGLEDAEGRLIDGDGNGQPGGDAIAILSRKVIKK
jgi:plastocyanin